MGLKEIAKMTGYSVSTVSRVLNNKSKYASSKAEKEIWAAAQKLHYARNDAAVHLKTGKSAHSSGHGPYRIGIVMARGLESLEDEFYQRIEEGIRSTVLKAGHQLGETFMLRTVLQNPQCLADINGIVLIGKCNVHNLTSLRIICKHIACTGMNPYYMEIDQIYCNGEHIARTAVQHLLSKGHQKIGYVGECNGDVRYFGYRQAVKSSNLDMDTPYVFDVPQTAEGGRQAARQYLVSEDCPTAVFCVNDVSAIGFIEALKLLRPQQPLPAVIGIGDISKSLEIQPALTTIHLPLWEMGNISARILLDSIEGLHSIPLKVDLPYKLVCRQSC